MTKQKRGMFRRIVEAGRKVIGLPVTHQYKDPVLKKPAVQQRVKKSKPRGKGLASKALPCIPGTITYHDMLVRKLGRRKADGYNQCIQRGMLSALPSSEELDAIQDWAWFADHFR